MPHPPGLPRPRPRHAAGPRTQRKPASAWTATGAPCRGPASRPRSSCQPGPACGPEWRAHALSGERPRWRSCRVPEPDNTLRPLVHGGASDVVRAAEKARVAAPLDDDAAEGLNDRGHFGVGLPVADVLSAHLVGLDVDQV